MFGYSVFQFGVDNTLPVLNNLVAWFDGADVPTVSFPLGVVTQWDDKSGNKFIATQGTLTRQPGYIANAVNGLHVLRFDGSADFLVLNADLVTGTTARTIFVACRATTGSLAAMVTMTQASGAVIYNVTSEISVAVGGGFERVFNEACVDTDTTVFFVVTIQSAATADVEDVLGRLDGVLMTEKSVSAGAIDTATSSSSRIGRNSQNRYFPGDIGEVIVYGGELSAAEIDTMENYLGVKWGVSIG